MRYEKGVIEMTYTCNHLMAEENLISLILHLRKTLFLHDSNKILAFLASSLAQSSSSTLSSTLSNISVQRWRYLGGELHHFFLIFLISCKIRMFLSLLIYLHVTNFFFLLAQALEMDDVTLANFMSDVVVVISIT